MESSIAEFLSMLRGKKKYIWVLSIPLRAALFIPLKENPGYTLVVVGE